MQPVGGRPAFSKSCFIIITIGIFSGNLLFSFPSPAQDITSFRYPEGISLYYGMGKYAVKDKYISGEKYTGTLPSIGIGWTRKHEKYIYHLKMEIKNSDQVENHNVSTQITTLTIHQGFLYALKSKPVFGRSAFFWLGPSTDIYIFDNDQNLAISGYDYAESALGLLSVGLSSAAVYPLSRNWQVESSLDITMLSIGFRSIDEEEDDESTIKPLTLISGLHTIFNLGPRYYMGNRFSIGIAYSFELVNVTEWNPLVSAGDNVIIGLSYKF